MKELIKLLSKIKKVYYNNSKCKVKTLKLNPIEEKHFISFLE
jgi:hypothetical protein